MTTSSAIKLTGKPAKSVLPLLFATPAQAKSTLHRHIAFGNKKLPKSTAIFNLGSATNCPSKARGLCKHHKICYAMKAEKMYKDSLPYRERQQIVWENLSADEFVSNFLAITKRKRTNKVTQLRFNESGDLHSQACLEKMERIATLLAKEGITTYTYTARHDLDFSAVNTLVVNGSGCMVTNEFRVVDEFSGENLQCAMDCSTCSLCSHSLGMVIEVVKH